MNPLLYSSNEMFSSTELIRKSKMIFDKLLKSEVEKAIILRDGKPGFMLLEFEKYEVLMKEYMALKEQTQANGSIKEEPKIKQELVQEVEIKEEIQEPIIEEAKTPELKKDESSEEQFEHIEEDISEDDLKKALQDIDKLDFDESKEEKKDEGIEDFDFQDEFIDVVKEKKEQPLKEFWD